MATSITKQEALEILSRPRDFVIADCNNCDHENDIKVDFAGYVNAEQQIKDTACERCGHKSLVLGSTT